jgi:predicted DNA-binding transcriptional regulator YafY
METFNKILKLEQIHQLIKLRSTGNAQEFSNKMGISVATLKREINTMRKLGCPIKYCRYSRSYYYEYEGEMNLQFRRRNSV